MPTSTSTPETKDYVKSSGKKGLNYSYTLSISKRPQSIYFLKNFYLMLQVAAIIVQFIVIAFNLSASSVSLITNLWNAVMKLAQRDTIHTNT